MKTYLTVWRHVLSNIRDCHHIGIISNDLSTAEVLADKMVRQCNRARRYPNDVIAREVSDIAKRSKHLAVTTRTAELYVMPDGHAGLKTEQLYHNYMEGCDKVYIVHRHESGRLRYTPLKT